MSKRHYIQREVTTGSLTIGRLGKGKPDKQGNFEDYHEPVVLFADQIVEVPEEVAAYALAAFPSIRTYHVDEKTHAEMAAQHAEFHSGDVGFVPGAAAATFTEKGEFEPSADPTGARSRPMVGDTRPAGTTEALERTDNPGARVPNHPAHAGQAAPEGRPTPAALQADRAPRRGDSKK